jgi:hypothetical protein
MILSGGRDGLIAISSRTTGMTVRVITDQQGAPITCIDVQFVQVIYIHYSDLINLIHWAISFYSFW